MKSTEFRQVYLAFNDLSATSCPVIFEMLIVHRKSNQSRVPSAITPYATQPVLIGYKHSVQKRNLSLLQDRPPSSPPNQAQWQSRACIAQNASLYSTSLVISEWLVPSNLMFKYTRLSCASRSSSLIIQSPLSLRCAASCGCQSRGINLLVRLSNPMVRICFLFSSH
jgi:hypothetical protein